ncbi:putative glutathione peroxidase 5 [Capsicum annuum]
MHPINSNEICSFTNSNYSQLTELYTKYRDKGFEVLAFPCNQFLNQSLGQVRKHNNLLAQDLRQNIPYSKRVWCDVP